MTFSSQFIFDIGISKSGTHSLVRGIRVLGVAFLDLLKSLFG